MLARRGDEERARRGHRSCSFAAAACSLPAAVLQLSVLRGFATLTAAICRSRQNGNELRVLAVLLECFWLVCCGWPACRLKQPPAVQCLVGARYACERRLGGALVLLRTNRLLASVLQDASSLCLRGTGPWGSSMLKLGLPTGRKRTRSEVREG